MGVWGSDNGADVFASCPLEDFRPSQGPCHIVPVRAQGDFHDGVATVPAAQYEVCLGKVVVFILGDDAGQD